MRVQRQGEGNIMETTKQKKNKRNSLGVEKEQQKYRETDNIAKNKPTSIKEKGSSTRKAY